MLRKYIWIISVASAMLQGCGDSKVKKPSASGLERNSSQSNALILSPQDIEILNNWTPGESKGNNVWSLEVL